MISYKDLMIGNWVYLSEKTKYPMQVVGIGEDYCYLNFKGNEADPFDGIDKDMMPIEVTEELLLKIGFKQVFKQYFIYEMAINDCFIEISHNVSNSIDKDWTCKIDNERYESIGGFDFHYLHELQNGIRLITKGDLEIKEL